MRTAPVRSLLYTVMNKVHAIVQQDLSPRWKVTLSAGVITFRTPPKNWRSLMTKTDEILFKREINALRVTIIFRLIFLFVMVVGTPFGGKSSLETTLVAGLCGPTLIFSVYSIHLLGKQKYVRMVGMAGAVLDVLIVSVLPIIWYFSVGGTAVAPAYMIKGPFYQAFLWAILIWNSFAIKPAYVWIIMVGGFLSVGGHFLYLVLEGRTVFTMDFVAHNVGSGLAPYFVFVTLAVIMAGGVGFIIFSRKMRTTLQSAARSEVAVNQLSRFFSPRIREEVIAQGDRFTDRGKLQNVAVLFSDIRSFTAMCETLSPEEVVAFLRDYHAVMVDVIFRNNGTLDKFIGDGIMATFGTPSTTGNDARNALSAAVEMQAALKSLNEARKAGGRPAVRIGIGMHYGPVVVGNVGSESRLEYTVIGDTVNIASRLESATKELNETIVFSEALRAELSTDTPASLVGDIPIRGKTGRLRVYTVGPALDRGQTPS